VNAPARPDKADLANQLVRAEKDEVARGIRRLLGTPIVHEAHDPETFTLLRARRDPLAKWFEYYCGWTLTVEPRLGYARLAKVRAHADGRRPARRERSGRAPFDRRRYTLLCVVAAELLATPVTTIGLLATRVERATAVDPVVPDFDTAKRSERLAYVDVLRHLERVRALEVQDGSTEAYVESADAKVLYRVDATLLLRLLAAPTGPSSIAPPPEEIGDRFDVLLGRLTDEPRYGGDDRSEAQHTLRLRHAVFRRLLDDPVVHRDELTDAELGYLTSPTGRRLLRDAAEQAGMVLEERAEGWLLVDPDGVATDTRFPDDGHAGVAALVLLDVLLAAPGGLTDEQLVVEAEGVLRREPRWAQAYRTDDGAARLAADAVEVLASFGLARREHGVVEARPAAARYALTGVTTRSSGKDPR
jgi:uncharacterized protein (TIGR02678 family)